MGSGNNGDNGAGSTANFAGMMKTVPPLNDLFNMAGLNLPTYLKGEDKVEKNNANDKEEPTENSIV
jgi:flotillin